MAKQTLHPKSDDMSKWYTQVILQSKLADYSPVRGSMVIRPNGYGIWEHIKEFSDSLFKKHGVENGYFPLFIPMSLLQREADHVEGFAPELAVVTHGGGQELEEKLAVRPTSETIMYEMYSKWVQSHRDLPLKINQWNNVVRWEKRTYFFLRTTEFLWQEAHTAHATHEESWRMVMDAIIDYRTIAEELLAVPVVMGRKSRSETFAGADQTVTIESMMPDGKALQSGTSHDLGQNFSQESAFNISFQNSEGENDYAWQVSFGLSTRIMGAIIMMHGDDDGLVLPPRVATTKVVIIPVYKKGQEEVVQNYCENLAKNIESDTSLYPGKVAFWSDQGKTTAFKKHEAEMQGIPLVIEVGPREVEANEVTIKYRLDDPSLESGKTSLSTAQEQVENMLATFQTFLLERARRQTTDLTSETDSYDEFKEIMNTRRGYIKSFWCEDDACEQVIKDETKATTRCLPLIDDDGNVEEESGSCVKCGKPATHRWLFAQAY